MSFFDDLLDALKDLWNEIRSALDSLIAKIKEYLPYIIILVALFVGFGGVLVMFGTSITGWWAAAALIGASFLVLPEETAAAVASFTDAVADGIVAVVEAVAPIIDAIGGAIGSGLSSVLGPLLPYILIGGGLWLYFGKSRDKEKAQPALARSPSSGTTIDADSWDSFL